MAYPHKDGETPRSPSRRPGADAVDEGGAAGRAAAEYMSNMCPKQQLKEYMSNRSGLLICSQDTAMRHGDRWRHAIGRRGRRRRCELTDLPEDRGEDDGDGLVGGWGVSSGRT
uniref:Uncharacterized protein n=1 Tax=Oryza meridionalis TaxID=40149 RepID=A0A0E0CLD0_9ORYZ